MALKKNQGIALGLAALSIWGTAQGDPNSSLSYLQFKSSCPGLSLLVKRPAQPNAAIVRFDALMRKPQNGETATEFRERIDRLATLHVHRILGEGGQGMTALVSFEGSDKKWAMKIEVEDSDESRQSFLREGEAMLAVLRNAPDVAAPGKLLRFGKKPVLLMEAMDGTLDHWLNKWQVKVDEGSATPEERNAAVLAMFRKLASRLDRLHHTEFPGRGETHQGLLHLDLKPGNIFFRGDEPYLGDLGLAEFGNDIVSNSARGTLSHLSPFGILGIMKRENDWWGFAQMVDLAFESQIPSDGKPSVVLSRAILQYNNAQKAIKPWGLQSSPPDIFWDHIELRRFLLMARNRSNMTNQSTGEHPTTSSARLFELATTRNLNPLQRKEFDEAFKWYVARMTPGGKLNVIFGDPSLAENAEFMKWAKDEGHLEEAVHQGVKELAHPAQGNSLSYFRPSARLIDYNRLIEIARDKRWMKKTISLPSFSE